MWRPREQNLAHLLLLWFSGGYSEWGRELHSSCWGIIHDQLQPFDGLSASGSFPRSGRLWYSNRGCKLMASIDSCGMYQTKYLSLFIYPLQTNFPPSAAGVVPPTTSYALARYLGPSILNCQQIPSDRAACNALANLCALQLYSTWVNLMASWWSF